MDAVGLLAGVDPPMARTTSSLLLKLLGNVLSQPGEARFRRLRLNNPVLRGSILETEGGLDLLLAAGFQLQPGDEADGGCGVGVGEAGWAMEPRGAAYFGSRPGAVPRCTLCR